VKPLERLALAALRKLDPELAHGLSLRAVNAGFAALLGPVTSDRLKTDLCGLTLPNPVGLAAGFDKNAEALRPLSRAGFGFIEVGATTPRPQVGNPKPRLFRLAQDEAAINRFGFNNQGADAMLARLARRPKPAIIGLNLGANKDSADRAADFSSVLESCGMHLDFATVNVSSPNTEKLRDLQGRAALERLLRDVLATRDALDRPIPVFLKIAPDLSHAELADVAEIALSSGIDAVITTNTTLDRTGLHGPHKAEKGGLSGAPLFERSTRVLARFYHLTQGKIPLIGVGGVGSAEQAYAKIKAGASAVQLYTAMVYGGLSLAADIARGLDVLARRDGLANISEARGQDTAFWLQQSDPL
jgi:dihydroorotate dehydrogenase